MAYTSRGRFEKIDVGSQIDTWGVTQNRTLDRQDEAINGALNLAINGDKSLIYANDLTDEAHYAAINITGGVGGRVILQPIQGIWFVKNGSVGNVTFTVGGTGGTILLPGTSTVVFCDGVNVHQLGFGGPLKQYIDDGLNAERAYADSLAFETVSGQLPGQNGNAGRFLKTNGLTAGWAQVNITDIADLAAELERNKSFAIAAAAIL